MKDSAPVSSTTIDPPAKFSICQYHWAYRQKDGDWLVFETRDGRFWSSLGYSLSGAALFERGFRYVGPAIPPDLSQEFEA